MNYFNKMPHPANMRFVRHFENQTWKLGEETFPVHLSSDGANIFRLQSALRHKRASASQAEWNYSPKPHVQQAPYHLRLATNGTIELVDSDGNPLLTSVPERPIGLCGSSYMCCFAHHESHRYYGMGEKLLGLELTGVKTRFWNTDAFADFDWDAILAGKVDPYYVSIPYIIIRTPHGWVGLLLNNPYPTFAATAAHLAEIEGHAVEEGAGACKSVLLGAEDGDLDLFLLAAPSLDQLTRLLQQLVGPTPLPPLWALGYHQCRWGYRSAEQLRNLQSEFSKHEIPVSAFWLDIDYMNGFRVFTFNKDFFPSPSQDLATLMQNGQKVVPILDPGVKRDPQFDIYQDGCQRDVFCQNPEGNPYVGIVWPGETVFPDFSLPEGREWWADLVCRFAQLGVEGAWLDMNDPSAGPVNLQDMLFQHGREPHGSFHNQYALGMARATRAGLLKARPNHRPFLLTRSNFISGARYAAVWTGDNASNYTYLRLSIPTSLNLALSGIPFNGADIGGFMEGCTDALLRDWTKTAFLFPFCRNHAEFRSPPQEPYARDAHTLGVCRDFIQSRYKLLPYLYQLFVAQEQSGAAILRPLFYDFDTSPGQDLDRIDDQFLVGPSILQAPILYEGATARDILLPGPAHWYSLLDGQWHHGGVGEKDVTVPETTTPLYFRAGSIIPMRPGIARNHHTALNEIELHIFLCQEYTTAQSDYVADDGETFGYENGQRSRLQIQARLDQNTLLLSVRQREAGYGTIRYRVIAHAPKVTAILLNDKPVKVSEETTQLAGSSLTGLASEWTHATA